MTWGEIRLLLTQFAGSGTSFDAIDHWLNAAYRDVLGAAEWTGLAIEGIIETVAPHSGGTVAVTAGSKSITGTGTAWTSQMDGRSFRVDGSPFVYTFYYTNDATHAELDRNYEDATAAAATYGIRQSVYVLPDDVQYVDAVFNPRTSQPLTKKTRAEMLAIRAGGATPGTPQFWAPSTDTPENAPPVRHQIELYPVPNEAIGLAYTGPAAVQEWDGKSSAASPLPWVSPDAILAGAKGLCLADGKQDYTGAQIWFAERNRIVLQMQANEARRKGPGKLRMADRYTQRRQLRWI